ncbi:MAG: helix-turn-helix domain-containing protein [Clostridia bacterium]|nr:helix-turn-helix domain-containing protein [Clostridia bacterium]
MSNRLFQGIVQQMSESIDRVIGVIDDSAAIVACSDPSRIGETLDVDFLELTHAEEPIVHGTFTCKAFGAEQYREFAVLVEGTDSQAEKYASLLEVSMASIKQFYDEKNDRANFIKNVILDNILPGDIYLKARELRFNTDNARAVLLIRITRPNDVSVYEIIQNLFPEKNKDFVININETDVALVKEVNPDIETKDLEKLARSLVDTLAGEFYTHAIVGIGSIVTGIKDLAKSFKDAHVALEVGKVFDNEKTIVSCDNLGIARLIYQLPTTLCETFLKEVFKRDSIESLDYETLFTIQRFFDNNLNVSETSRKLFVHRNTLVYRLEKIKKLTGLDLREFEHAIVFKIALMVNKYLSANPVKY